MTAAFAAFFVLLAPFASAQRGEPLADPSLDEPGAEAPDETGSRSMPEPMLPAPTSAPAKRTKRAEPEPVEEAEKPAVEVERVEEAPAPPARKPGRRQVEPDMPDAPVEPAPQPARASRRGGGGSLRLVAYDEDGRVLDVQHLLALIGRRDRSPDAPPTDHAIVATTPDGAAGVRPTLSQQGPTIVVSWEKLPRVKLSLPWPIREDGFSTLWLDNGGKGYGDGEVVYLNEELAETQYRLFKEALERRTTSMSPGYQPGPKTKKALDKAREALAEAQRSKDGRDRAKAFDDALREISLAWQKVVFEHGLQVATDEKKSKSLRFGLTLDASIMGRLDHYEWIVEMLERARVNWVRLVFKPNPNDFTYSKLSSFNEYDGVVKALRAANIRVMGTVLDTNQWPSTLTPERYAERTRNLVLHYSNSIKSWEVGVEVNGSWLGGTKEPLSQDAVFRIFTAAAAEAKSIEPGLETVVTLYWWDGTAPSHDHTLFGWLAKYAPRGMRNIDVVGVSLFPEDNPVGMALDTIFHRVHQFVPDKRVMISSFGYAEEDKLNGHWWIDPKDESAGRKDLLIFYTTAACSFEKSIGGGFWWQTLDQMLPGKRKNTELYRVYAKTLEQLGR